MSFNHLQKKIKKKKIGICSDPDLLFRKRIRIRIKLKRIRNTVKRTRESLKRTCLFIRNWWFYVNPKLQKSKMRNLCHEW